MENIITLNKLRRLKMFSGNVIILIFISFFIYIIFTIFNIYSFGFVNELTPADAAVVLGASVWNDKPSPVFQERINHGIWLYKNGYVKYLIFTGGKGKNSSVSEASAAKNFAINNSVPIERIFMEEMSTITLENIIFARKIINDNHFNKIILVSDPLHMKRSITMAKDFNINAYSSPTPTTRYISLNTKLKFLFYELFFYVLYKIYRYSLVLVLYLILFKSMFAVYYYHIFRHNGA